MHTFLLTLHIILCVLLTLIIMMQPGKGADLSSAFGGGGASQLFGAAGPGNFLTKGTGAIAALFMLTSISLALLGSGNSSLDGFEDLQDEGGAGAGFGNSAPPAENSLPPLPAPAGIPAPSDVAPSDVAPSDVAPAPAGN